uniref:Endonuclease/exonuclease/phosphatase domain-containing protein n=1 Tax=Anopheles farauti TaxID=69004 RepID=A0A182QN36_9DIPT
MKQRLLILTPWLLHSISRPFCRCSCSSYVPPVTRAFRPPILNAMASSFQTRSLHQNPDFGRHRYWYTVGVGKQQCGKNKNRNSRAKACAAAQPTETDRDRYEFTLMCYNILAQDLLESHGSLYADHDPRSLTWNHRYERLKAEINLVQPDVLCVQELQENHTDYFIAGLRQDYKMLYKKRTGGEKTDGCALLYRSDLFDLVTYHKIEYFQPKVNKLNRENVAIVAKLALKANPRAKIVVATTHLLYNPRRQDIRLAQVQLLLAELDRFAYSGTNENGIPRYDPVVLCGDFNLQPFSAPYELLLTGNLRYEQLASRSLRPTNSHGYEYPLGKYFLPPALGITDKCQHNVLRDRSEQGHCDKVPPSHVTKLYHSTHRSARAAEPVPNMNPENTTTVPVIDCRKEFSSGSLTHRFVFKSAYRHNPRDPEERQQATTFQDEWITVDYLFYTPYRSVDECNKELPNWNLELLQTYALPTVQQCCWEIGAIPNRVYGSDHFALAGRFLLTVPKA